MKFGEILLACQMAHQSVSRWRYLDYNSLKESIRQGVSRAEFDCLLVSEMQAVDDCYEERFRFFEELSGDHAKGASTAELRRYVVLNYLAVLKIQKKAARWLGEPEMPLCLLSMALCRSLQGSTLFVKTAPSHREVQHLGDSSCPICLEAITKVDHATLSCGHVFCWVCLARCAASGQSSCPLCRSTQSLDPTHRLIEAILGQGVPSTKYHPELWMVGQTEQADTVVAESPLANHVLSMKGFVDVTGGRKQLQQVQAQPRGLQPRLKLKPMALPIVDRVADGMLASVPLASRSEVKGMQMHQAVDTCCEPTVPSPNESVEKLPVDALKVLSWNICAIAYPFAAPWLSIVAGLLVWCDWTDVHRDVPIDSQGERARARWRAQAKYIEQSGADLILLQEVSSRATLDSILSNFGEAFEAVYVSRMPSGTAVAVWVLALLVLTLMQLSVLILPIEWAVGFRAPASFLFSILLCANAWRWRHSCVKQYLLGMIAGQLVVLRRKSSCKVHAFDDATIVFEPFTQSDGKRLNFSMGLKDDAQVKSRGKPQCNSKLLQAFFSLRSRGVLRVRSILRSDVHQSTECLTVMNTHFPHASDTVGIMDKCAELTFGAALSSAVIFGGDLNPLPNQAISTQLQPLLNAGNRVRDGSEQVGSCPTWDLTQPLTRCTDETPRTMQLDFVLCQSRKLNYWDGDNHRMTQRRPASAQSPKRISLGKIQSELYCPEAFRSAPISDHVGLLSSILLILKTES